MSLDQRIHSLQGSEEPRAKLDPQIDQVQLSSTHNELSGMQVIQEDVRPAPSGVPQQSALPSHKSQADMSASAHMASCTRCAWCLHDCLVLSRLSRPDKHLYIAGLMGGTGLTGLYSS